MSSLAQALPEETARVRALMPAYREIGQAGRFALALMEQSLRRADAAMVSGDIVEMIGALKDLEGFTA